MEEDYNPNLICSLTMQLMRDPVIDSDGNTYEKSAIEDWLRLKGTSPMTRKPMHVSSLRPNRALKNIIEDEMRKKGAIPAADTIPLPAFQAQAPVQSSGQAGRYRVVGEVGASLRQTSALDSPMISTIPMGTIVTVLEIQGRRARLDAPYAGWVSLYSADGYVIMTAVTNCSCGSVHSAGSYRVVGEVGAQVRETEALDSPLVATLLPGTFVEVVEAIGRRGRIVSPQGGWLSFHAAEGYVICMRAQDVTRRMRVVGEAGATLRKEEALDSELITTLTPSSVVLAVETRGRRVRVIEPSPGWCSVTSAEGYVILRDI
jgi:hypothetical protein